MAGVGLHPRTPAKPQTSMSGVLCPFPRPGMVFARAGTACPHQFPGGRRTPSEHTGAPSGPAAARWRAYLLSAVARKVHTSSMCRAVLATVIALWIAILPTVGAMAFAPQPTNVAMSDDGGMPCDKPMDDGRALTACALKCFQLCADDFVSPLTLPARHGDTVRLIATDAFYSHLIVPPFRPPAA